MVDRAMTLRELLCGAEKRLGIVKNAGVGGLGRSFALPSSHDQTSLRTEDLADFITRSITIISPYDLGHFAPRVFYQAMRMLPALVKDHKALILCAETRKIPVWMRSLVAHHGIAVVASRFDRHLLKSRLTGLIREKVEQIVVHQGGLIEIDGQGFLIIGDSGRGKTTCALCLAKRGARWIADDRAEIKRKGHQLIGRSPERIQGLVASRERGIMRVESFLDRSALVSTTTLSGVVELIAPSPEKKRKMEPSENKTTKIMGIVLPRMLISVPADEDRYCAWEDIFRNGCHRGVGMLFPCPLKKHVRAVFSGGSA